MSDTDNGSETSQTLDLNRLEERIDDLIQAIADVSVENDTLRSQQTQLMTERSALIEKSELARARVESMISRLKAMEVNS